MGKQLYLNNFDTLIIAAVKSSPSTGSPNTELDYGILRVAAGAAGALGTLSNGDYYILTAYKKSGTVESNREIWRVTYIDTSVINETRLTVSRAQEGTTAQSFVAGDYVSMRLTTGGLSNLLQRGGDTLSGALNGAPAVTIASGTNTDIGAAGSNGVTISGTTTITGLGSIAAGARRWVTFSGALVITHNATSLILPGAANITTVAGDCAEFVSLGSGNWKCTGYTKATVTGTGSTVLSDSPALAGTPTAPTAAAGTNTTQLATTAHVVAERSASRALTNLTGLTVASGGASITGNTSVTGTLGVSSTLSTTSGSAVRLYRPDNATYTDISMAAAASGGLIFNNANGDGFTFKNTGSTVAEFSSTGLTVTGNSSATGTIYSSTRGTSAGFQLPDWLMYNTSSGNALVWNNGSDRMTLNTSGDLLPGANGTQAFGSTSLRWSQVWCTAGAFNTSDAALKTPIRSMQSAELDAGYQMAQELGTFQWLESIKEKGDKARRHVGLTVQRAAEILEAHGLDAWSYGFMGYDKWPAVTEIADATEEDEGAYQEKVTQQKTVKQTSQTQTVEVINGKPTLKVETVESDVPVTEQIQVIDAEGKLVFTTVAEVPAVFDDEGNEVSPAVPAHMVPMMHAVPVMETVTVWKRVKEVRPAGESYAFRSDQLAFFIAAGVAAKVGA